MSITKEKRQKLILLVEDNSTTAFIETALLEKNGFKVICANTGEAAVEFVLRSPDINLVLMDINLGDGMDGIDAAKIILKTRDIPLIFLSSHTETEIIEKTEGITSYGYVVKNFVDALLIASIKMAFRLFDAHMKEKEFQVFRSRIFENSTLPIVVMETEKYRFIDCNPAAATAFGYSSIEETLGKTPFDVSAPVQYDKEPSSDKAVKFIKSAMAEGCTVFEWLHKRPDGTMWDAEVYLTHFRSEEKDYLQFTLIDITSRKRIEEELKKKINPYFNETSHIKKSLLLI